ncbi:hypothetical protein F2Q68_00009082 [Brassica cretica]|uniref:Uncharacterized protein n=1 Tax=Brassica cretica TaxID=69181 RepID=A0A3N6QFQ3_BRACR|nr:hypothetical protein F2Q68_00009082 [Brassica cretica]
MKRVPPTTREKPSLDHLIRPHDTKTVIKQTDYDLNRILIQRPSNWSPHDQNSVHVPITSTPKVHSDLGSYSSSTTVSIHRQKPDSIIRNEKRTLATVVVSGFSNRSYLEVQSSNHRDDAVNTPAHGSRAPPRFTGQDHSSG